MLYAFHRILPLVASSATTLPRKVQRFFGLESESGVRVMEIVKGSPAAVGGLRTDDTIVAIDGVAVEGVDALQRVLDGSKIDLDVEVSVLRGTRQVEVGVRPVEQLV